MIRNFSLCNKVSLPPPLLACAILLLFSVNASAQTKGSKWEPPKTADDIHNPFTNDAAATQEGKTNYHLYCAPCHGDKGRGDGAAAAGLSVKPADHSSAAIQSKSDGALFWEMSEGHSPMPAYKTTLTEQQRWQLVNFIRTLAKTHKP
jgi:mono/diheme cytochrome c family protein